MRQALITMRDSVFLRIVFIATLMLPILSHPLHSQILSTFDQLLPTILHPSPTAASIARYGEYRYRA